MKIVVLVVLASAGCNLLTKEDGPTASASAATTSTAQPLASTSTSDSGAASPEPKKTATPAPTPAPSAAKKAAVPTCKSGEALVTLAMSPFRPECAPTCQTDADCKVETCLSASLVDDNGQLKGGDVKVCNREYPKPPKCKAGEHLDTIYNKCRPAGDCGPNRWDEATKKCVYK